MDTTQTKTQKIDIQNRYPDLISVDSRQGFQGYFVNRSILVDFAKTVRDEYGYDYLTSVTGYDNYPENNFEVVYHAYKTTGGPALEFKVQTERENPIIPSLQTIYPGVDFQEREIWDLYGIKFEGHDDLRRILLWEGFSGHPLRKDWHEAYYEDEVKPFKSRYPDGNPYKAEDKNPFGNNIKYPENFDPFQNNLDIEDSLYEIMQKIIDSDQSGLRTERIIVNLGPQHPSTHGVFRLVVALEGETILELKPVMGYLHRNHEKIGERNTFLQNMPYTDRLDYICSMSNNFGYAIAIEKLMGIKPTERAEYIRVMMAELTRINNHLMANGFLLNDLGAFFTPALYALEERELILDIFEAVSGSRMMCNYFRFGGVVRDIQDDILEKVKHLVMDRLPRKMEEFNKYITNNEIVRSRCEGNGILTAQKAISLAASGPLLRASGVPYDIRRAEPYSIYDRFDFDVAIGMHGDIYDRYLVRIEEINQSLRIIRQVMDQMPSGPVMSIKPQVQVRVPPGEAYGRVESPKGELGFYIVSNGKPNPVRYHVRTPSFVNLTSLAEMSRGEKIADAVVILGSIDIILGEVDR